IATASGTMGARTYGGGLTAFGGAGGDNVPLNPENVSGSRFISTATPATDLFRHVQPITFTFSQPVQSFGLTTLDLLEDGIWPTRKLTLRAFDEGGALIAEHTRTGPQGPSGLDLDWLVASPSQNIVSASLSGSFPGGYGIDDLMVGRPTGNLSVWGKDADGQTANTPVNGSFKAIAAGPEHNLALRADGTIAAWGRNDFGEVSDAPTESGFVAIGAGHSSSIGVQADGSIATWGAVWGDQPTTGTYIAVAAGHSHWIGLSTDGALVTWGSDSYGRVTDTPTGDDFVAVDASLWHSVALREDGTIAAWGVDDGGSLDSGQVSDTPTDDGFVAIAAGGHHNLALRDDGSLISWGKDLSGQVSETPTGNDFIAVAAGYYYSLALKSDGAIVSWGDDRYGQVTYMPTEGSFTDIAGGRHGIALVPEPATLSLLAFGGLVMLRRRKACH
ncbi:MAG: PEP-CTERM sorting domain-containing protein, partial [Phycisphaerae bacterium]|nr:PEP-CTERM sorting domain-containing protein [Phycisphaerae bacterium]